MAVIACKRKICVVQLLKYNHRHGAVFKFTWNTKKGMGNKMYEKIDVIEYLSGISYPGRGIICGMTEEITHSVSAYFIMGRSANSRNRVFREEGNTVTIYPHDPSKVEDPSLVIYSPVRQRGYDLIVTNGDQTDTIYDGLCRGISMEEALMSRTYEPDEPNYTPRISCVSTIGIGAAEYKMSILKSLEAGGACLRSTWAYEGVSGTGHIIHTYEGDGNPLPSFSGEPRAIAIPSDINTFAADLWNALDEENKISLWVRYTEWGSQKVQTVVYNKYD